MVRALTLLVKLKAAKTQTVIYKINGREFYCAVDLPLAASFIIF